MVRRILQTALAAAAVFISACGADPALAPEEPEVRGGSTPADGNGNKFVFAIDENLPVDCGSDVLNLHAEGWAQFKLFTGAGNRNIELDVWHIVLTYSNSAGETWVHRDVGPDHWYFDQDGNLIVSITGRSTWSGVIGHVVFNFTTGEAELVAGNAFGNVDAVACAALT